MNILGYCLFGGEGKGNFTKKVLQEYLAPEQKCSKLICARIFNPSGSTIVLATGNSAVRKNQVPKTVLL